MVLAQAYKRLYACLLLLILLSAQTGQKVHIYREDHAHFAAFCGDLVPDNGAQERIVERCVVDDYGFFPCVAAAPPLHLFYCTAVVLLRPAATSSRQASVERALSLRAPPAA